MSEGRNIVLGGGLSGLIFATLHPDYLVVTKDIGGLLNTKNMAPFMIHHSWASLQFLNLIRIPYITKRCRVGYYFGSSTHDYLPPDLANEYYEKSRGIAPKKKLKGKEPGESDFLYFDIDERAMIANMIDLIGSENIHLKRAEWIDPVRKFIAIEGEYIFNYKRLISTLPASVFFRLIGDDLEFKTAGKIFVPDSDPPDLLDMKEYNYVYFPETKFPWLRVTKVCRDIYTYEYSSLNYTPGDDAGAVDYAYLLEPKKIPSVKGVEFLGRFAEWDEDVLLHNVIDRLFWSNLM